MKYSRTICLVACPHPGPLPRGEGVSFASFWNFVCWRLHAIYSQDRQCALAVPSPGGEGQGEGGRKAI